MGSNNSTMAQSAVIGASYTWSGLYGRNLEAGLPTCPPIKFGTDPKCTVGDRCVLPFGPKGGCPESDGCKALLECGMKLYGPDLQILEVSLRFRFDRALLTT
jgi:hypothetical protein